MADSEELRRFPGFHPAPRTPFSDLDADQRELARKVIAAAASVDRPRRRFILHYGYHPNALELPDGTFVDVLSDDLRALERAELLSGGTGNYIDQVQVYDLTAVGHELVLRTLEDPAGVDARVEAEARALLDKGPFRDNFPDAHRLLNEADQLYRIDAQGNATTIGHKLREAMIAFATEALALRGITDAEKDVQKVKKRLGAVIASIHTGDSTRGVLEKLGDLWESVWDLAQRQEHGALKEGEPLTAEDSRRLISTAVFCTSEFAALIATD